MKNKLFALVVFLVTVLSTSSYAALPLIEDLPTIAVTATDIIRYKCPNIINIIGARAKIMDDAPINAVPKVTVHIASASGTTCPGKNDAVWNALSASESESENDWADEWTGTLNGLTSASYYCLKVTKSAAAKDDYQVDHHCLRSFGPQGVWSSTNKTMILDE